MKGTIVYADLQYSTRDVTLKNYKKRYALFDKLLFHNYSTNLFTSFRKF